MQNQGRRKHSNRSEEIKQRYIPTFVHHPIFEQQPCCNYPVRLSSTFYSTALDTEGYNIKTIHCPIHKINFQSIGSGQTVVYSNYSHERRIQDLNPKAPAFYSSRDKWYDHTKENRFDLLRNRNDLCSSKQRKLLELSSADVFTDLAYGSKINENPTKQSPNYQQIQTFPDPNHESQKTCNISAETKKDQINREKKPQSSMIDQTEPFQKLTKQNIDNLNNGKETKIEFNKMDGSVKKKLQNERAKNTIVRSQFVNEGKKVCKNPSFSLLEEIRFLIIYDKSFIDKNSI